ncbi:hypothetical protein NC653_004972 [Populus alba x Populus x berolinensis]|uniref:Uncharacterized protein n=1 Tax=Populus alba x Populus x berolinensis TaxID=444605 RepID=A0AAD6WCH2_9ROSI|nr:hypothetical protein NC653_004972 [Populus alba x Populus x berolinensis]
MDFEAKIAILRIKMLLRSAAENAVTFKDSATTISSSPNNKASETANQTGALAEVSLQKEDALSEEKRDLDPYW